MKEHEKNISINITSSSITKGILLILLFAALYQILDVVLWVLTAVVIASAVEPFTKWLVRHSVSRLPAVIIIYLCAAGLLVGITYFIVPVLLNDFAGYLANLPQYLDYAQSWIPLKSGVALEGSNTFKQLSETSNSLSHILSNFSASLSTVSESFVRSVSVVFGGVLSFMLIVVLSFYLAVQEDGVGDFLKLITPKNKEAYIADLWRRAREKIGLWMQGQLLLGVTVGVLIFLFLTIFNIKHALLLAVLAAVFELIPVFGPIMSAIPGVLSAITDSGPWLGLIVAGWYIVIQQFENHLFYPMVVKKVVGISPIVVIIALIVGGKLAGFLGIVLAIPLSTALMEYIHDLQKDKLHDAEALYKA